MSQETELEKYKALTYALTQHIDFLNKRIQSLETFSYKFNQVDNKIYIINNKTNAIIANSQVQTLFVRLMYFPSTYNKEKINSEWLGEPKGSGTSIREKVFSFCHIKKNKENLTENLAVAEFRMCFENDPNKYIFSITFDEDFGRIAEVRDHPGCYPGIDEGPSRSNTKSERIRDTEAFILLNKIVKDTGCRVDIQEYTLDIQEYTLDMNSQVF